MFEDLQNIDWSNLKQAHGDSQHVPDAIKGLISTNYEEQKASYWKLDNYVVLQGDLYESAFYVIPFLLEILESHISNGRNYVYDLLFELANGYPVDDTIKCEYKGENLPLNQACQKSINEGMNLYLKEISDVHSVYRENALDLVTSLESASKTIPILSKVLQMELDSNFKSILAEAIFEINRV